MGALKGSIAVAVVAHMLSFQGCTLPDPSDSSLERIMERGSITVLTRDALHTHYTYRNQQAGFDYDLARAFADHLGVGLKMRSVSQDKLMGLLKSGKGDFVAAGFRVSPNRENLADYSEPYARSQVHIVAHKDNREIFSPEDLRNKSVYVRKGSAEEEALKRLRDTGIPFEVISRKKTLDSLLSMVENRQIELTAAGDRTAGMYRRYHPSIQTCFPVGDPMPIAWAIAPGQPALRDAMNRFLEQAQKDGTLHAIQTRYFGDGTVHEYLDLRRFHNRMESRLPRYQDMIQDVAHEKDLDWRLIAAMMYQESHYDPYAVSHTGVRGLMQITQVTALEMGIENRLDPKQSIEAGADYLIKLMGMFPEVPDQERLPLALASYNVGYGHVRDAMSVARDLDLNPLVWPSLEKALPLLRKRQYYANTRYGYCRGQEPVQYVNNVMTYYDILRRKAVVLRS
ncbi:MAG: membrane-bound lytic murein transglycosylase MltF [Desulfatibacillum sp.]|nr:membrane-bound lytic murein transglycosylase MltF [Desulfatibacillum sp.]